MDGATSPPDLSAPGLWQQTSSLLALRAVLNASVHVNQVVARRAGMSVSEVLALTHLSVDRIGPAEIARRLAVSTAASSGIVDRLVARGHVVRRPDPRDRRRTELVLSDAGRRTVMEQLLPMFAALDRLDRQLDPRERDVVSRYLNGVLDVFVEFVDGPSGSWPQRD
jgi:DNA-binding MarR family transcriptional regulator